MNKVFKYILLTLNIIAVLGLLIAVSAPVISPVKVSFIAFVGLLLPYTLIINVLFIIFWILKARFYFMISLLTIVITWSTIRTSFSYTRAKEDQETTSETFKVMSYNVRVFDRYHWTKNTSTASEMFKFIKSERPDIICIQEFGASKTGITESYVLNALGAYPYTYIHYIPNKENKKHITGLAIISKYPLSNTGLKGDPYMKGSSLVHADVKIENKKYTIYNAHFESLSVTNKADITRGLDKENYKDRFLDAIYSFNKTSKEHTEFSNTLTNLATTCNYPAIVCADMNNSPVSYSYKTIANALDDSYLEHGIGFGATYNGKYPFLRIDYIFHSTEIPLISYKRERVKYSDHFPIISEFSNMRE